MTDEDRCDNGFVWNSTICQCECEKSCDAGEYLDYTNFNSRRKLIDKIVKKCDENVDGNGLVYNPTLTDYGRVCNSCTLYISLLFTTFTSKRICAVSDALN